MGNHDLPQNYGPAAFRITKENGKSFTLNLSKRKRQIVEALNIGPLYAASPIRLSDVVGILRHENDISIQTEFFNDNSGPVPSRFGIYTISDNVEYLGEVNTEVAA